MNLQIAEQAEFESTVHGIWCQLLNRSEIDRTDDFFSIGGDSILVAKLVLLLEEKGINASIQDIHEKPSIAAFTECRVEEAMKNVEVVYKWSEMELENVTKAIGRKAIHGAEATVSHLYLDAGAIVPIHQHPNEQYTIILKGSLKFKFGEAQEREKVVGEGSVLYIPANLPHSAEALEDTIDLDIFTPIREDWRNGTDTYFTESTG